MNEINCLYSKHSEDKSVRITMKLRSIKELVGYRLNESEKQSQKERGDKLNQGEILRVIYFSYFCYSFLNILRNFYIKWHFDDKLDHLFVSTCERFFNLCSILQKKCKETVRIHCLAEHTVFSISSTSEHCIRYYFFAYYTALWVKFFLPATRIFSMHIFSA